MALLSFPEITPLAYALAMAIVFIASIVQSTLGMGFGQVAAPLLFLINTDFAPAPILIMGMFVATISAVKYRRNIALNELKLALGGRIAGSFIAALLLFYLAGQTEFSLLFAGLVLLAVGLSLGKWHVAPTPKMLLLAGSASGFMGTFTSVGAPPMGIVYQHAPAHKVRATLNAFFALGTLASLAALGWFELLRTDHLILAFALMPALLAGSWVSKFVTAFVDKRFRKLVLGISVVSSLAIIWDALT